jgi:hypothetical protein
LRRWRKEKEAYVEFFTSGLFWFIEGLLACLAIMGLKLLAQDRSIPMPWWKWVLTALWVCLAGFTLALVGTSLGEGEPRAAAMGGIIFGVLSIIVGVAFWRLLGFSNTRVTRANDS